jgi:hypothetical protein
MLSLLLGHIFAVWWSLTNQPCLHEGDYTCEAA